MSIPTQSNTSGHLCCCAREDSSRGSRTNRTSHRSPHRRHRRRHRRLLHCIPLGEAGLDRHGAAGEAQAHLRQHLPRGRLGGPAAHQRQHHAAAGQLGGAVQDPGSRDRAGNRLEDERRPAPGVQRGALDGGEAAGHHRQELRAGDAPALPAGGPGSVAADGDRRCGGRCVPAHRRAGQPQRHHDGPRTRCTHARRDHLRRHRGAAHRGGSRRDQGRRHRRTGWQRGPHRVREGGRVRRPVDSRAVRDRGCERAAGAGGAPVRDHRAVHTRGTASRTTRRKSVAW